MKKAAQISTPEFTIAALRRGPADLPNLAHSAGCGSMVTPGIVAAAKRATSKSAPRQAPWTMTIGRPAAYSITAWRAVSTTDSSVKSRDPVTRTRSGTLDITDLSGTDRSISPIAGIGEILDSTFLPIEVVVWCLVCCFFVQPSVNEVERCDDGYD